jgi:hypothetical protein
MRRGFKKVDQGTFSRPSEDEQLLLQQQILGDHHLHPALPQEYVSEGDQIRENHE